MSSETDICNLALGHLGDIANIASISPPDGSIQSQHAATFYPIARDSLLEMRYWNFATTRVPLSLLATQMTEWAYIYAAPTDALRFLAVLASDAPDDYSSSNTGLPNGVGIGFGDVFTPESYGIYTPQPFAVESDSVLGTPIILTNLQGATLRYTKRVTDSTRFTPLFTRALSWLLASDLAGPVLKGDIGAAATERCYKMAMTVLAAAAESNANSRSIRPKQQVPWIARR